MEPPPPQPMTLIWAWKPPVLETTPKDAGEVGLAEGGGGALGPLGLAEAPRRVGVPPPATARSTRDTRAGRERGVGVDGATVARWAVDNIFKDKSEERVTENFVDA